MRDADSRSNGSSDLTSLFAQSDTTEILSCESPLFLISDELLAIRKTSIDVLQEVP